MAGDVKTCNKGDGWIYEYDAHGRLTRAAKAGTEVCNAYDGEHRCVKREITVSGSTQTRYYLWNGW